MSCGVWISFEEFPEWWMLPVMKVSMIAACDENRLIGSAEGIPWQLPRDTEHFRSYTQGKAMLVGRRTFGEMEGWFTTQRPIVLSSNQDFDGGCFSVAPDLEAALGLARSRGEDELVVSGGAQVYELAMPVADELLITEVHAIFAGCAYFPAISPECWFEIKRERFEADEENPHAMSFVYYQRR